MATTATPCATFEMAVGRLPDSAEAPCSQPTLSRLENAPGWRTLGRMMAAMVDLFRDGWRTAPKRIVIDIDDTWDEAHGAQRLSRLNAHHGGDGFPPIHIYEATSAMPAAAIPRPGKTPDGREARAILRRVIPRIRKNWPSFSCA